MSDNPIPEEPAVLESSGGTGGSGAVPGKSSRKRGFLAWLTATRTFLIDAVVVGSILAVLYLTLSEVFDNKVVIEEIVLPESLTKMGYSGQIASLRLWDALRKVNEETAENSDLDKQTPLLTEARQLEITESQTGLSLSGLTQMLRRVFWREQRRIAGEVVCGDPECSSTGYELRLRVFQNGRVWQIRPGPIGDISYQVETSAKYISKKDIKEKDLYEKYLDRYFEKAALKVLEIIDPIVVAEYYNGKNSEISERIARRIVDHGEENQTRAAALLVQIYAERGDFEQAERAKDRVIALSSFRETYWDGVALTMLGQYPELSDEKTSRQNYQEAVKKFARADWIDVLDSNAVLYLWRGNSLLGLEQYKCAASNFERLAELQPENSVTQAQLGYSLFHVKDENSKIDEPIDEPAAVEHFERALQLGTNTDIAYSLWGKALSEIGRYDDAADIYRKAIKNGSKESWFYYYLGYNLFEADRPDEAEKAFQKFVGKNSAFTINEVWAMAFEQAFSSTSEISAENNREVVCNKFDQLFLGLAVVFQSTERESLLNDFKSNQIDCE